LQDREDVIVIGSRRVAYLHDTGDEQACQRDDFSDPHLLSPAFDVCVRVIGLARVVYSRKAWRQGN
jgi:hypothetical protein